MKCFVIRLKIGATGIVNKKQKSVNNTRKACNKFSTKSSCARDTAHNKESATV
jgi:hypothetical protein